MKIYEPVVQDVAHAAEFLIMNDYINGTVKQAAFPRTKIH
jgi:hypothetical protein